MSAHVLLNFLNELRKRDKMRHAFKRPLVLFFWSEPSSASILVYCTKLPSW